MTVRYILKSEGLYYYDSPAPHVWRSTRGHCHYFDTYYDAANYIPNIVGPHKMTARIVKLTLRAGDVRDAILAEREACAKVAEADHRPQLAAMIRNRRHTVA